MNLHIKAYVCATSRWCPFSESMGTKKHPAGYSSVVYEIAAWDAAGIPASNRPSSRDRIRRCYGPGKGRCKMPVDPVRTPSLRCGDENRPRIAMYGDRAPGLLFRGAFVRRGVADIRGGLLESHGGGAAGGDGRGVRVGGGRSLLAPLQPGGAGAALGHVGGAP